MSPAVETSRVLVACAAKLLEQVKDKESVSLSDEDRIRSAMRETEGYLASVRKIFDGRPL